MTASSRPTPRNLRNAVLNADESLIVSFVGQTKYANAHIFADSGVRYDWGFIADKVHAIIMVKPGIDASDAIRGIFDNSDPMLAYPTLVDVQAQHVACVIDGHPIRLWQTKRGSELWRQFFD